MSLCCLRMNKDILKDNIDKELMGIIKNDSYVFISIITRIDIKTINDTRLFYYCINYLFNEVRSSNYNYRMFYKKSSTFKFEYNLLKRFNITIEDGIKIIKELNSISYDDIDHILNDLINEQPTILKKGSNCTKNINELIGYYQIGLIIMHVVCEIKNNINNINNFYEIYSNNNIGFEKFSKFRWYIENSKSDKLILDEFILSYIVYWRVYQLENHFTWIDKAIDDYFNNSKNLESMSDLIRFILIYNDYNINYLNNDFILHIYTKLINKMNFIGYLGTFKNEVEVCNKLYKIKFKNDIDDEYKKEIFQCGGE